WTFGDPASGTNDTSTLANPVHVFSAAGSYTVSLVVYRCENDTVKNTVNVFSAPTADFLLSDACFGDTVHFTNTSVVPPSTTLIWNFGDGTAYNGNVLHPAHYYQPGYYTVTLKAITTQGCSDSAAALIKVYDRPDVTFNFNNHCLYDTVHFANTTTNPTMGIVSNWVWDFGDGALPNSNNWSVSHLYDFPGTYQVVLIANSSNSCSDTLTDSVIIYPKPNPDFSHTDICLNQTMNFSDESNISTGSISFWSWNFGDSSMLSIIQNPVHAYANAGTYTVSLITTSNTGCKDTISKNTVVHPLPVAGYSAANVCEGSFASFTDLSVIPNPDNIQTWSWDLGDGTILSNQNTSHLYSQLGSYSVKLTINSNFGCVDSISKLFIVNPQPAAGFSVSDTAGCEPLCVIFQNTSFVVDGTIVSWFWNFGDNTSANGQQDITHCYLNFNGLVPLSFSPSLTVISDSGCISLLTKNNYITVFPTPDAAFIVSPQITTLVEPTLLVTNTSGEADLWIWDFGDQQTALIANPESHTYADTGTYLITLIASTQYTCADTAYQTVIIEPDFIFYIPNAFTPNEDGINDTFTGKGVFINEFEMYIFDRWGNLIYKTDDLNKPWDGKANNGTEIAQKDVYVYLMKVSDFKMNTHKYRGTVTLVR
ncbi:MAG: PKD domain-containing protein, partial [Chitinophagaceae bacterium]